MKSGVYKITNIVNNKCYIGSSYDIKKRTNCHFNQLRKNIHTNSHLQRSFNKHGEDRFAVTTIIKCSIEELLILEQYLIDFYQPSYNICKIAGSTLGFKPSLESRLKGAESRRIYYQNNPMSDEVKEKHRIASLGKKHTDQSKKKLSESKKNLSQKEKDRINASKFKSVNQIDPITNSIINTFTSIKEAALHMNIHYCNISDVIAGRQKLAKGYFWELVNK